MNVVLVNPYEIGRQPFGLAQPAAILRRQGHQVSCVDLSLQRLADAPLADADVIALYLAMHTATRIAVTALPGIREIAPGAHLCAYGLYAPVNEALLRECGVETVLGGEFENALLSMLERLGEGRTQQSEPLISVARIDFQTPDRTTLPALDRYANLVMPDGTRKTVAFAEATRGCKHLCRHCPVVPVYQGRFRTVPVDVIMRDIAQQHALGARHVSFGDPDFLNGPGHARRVIGALREGYPEVTFDCTIKIEHLIRYADLLPVMRDGGCVFVTSAVEAVDAHILEVFDKRHTVEDFRTAVALMREHGIALAPTFVAFTPWTTLQGYLELLRTLVSVQLVRAVPPIQLAIRLLVPSGSLLLERDEMRPHLQAFDQRMLGYPWDHPDPRVDELQRAVQSLVAAAEQSGQAREETFEAIWQLAHRANDRVAPRLQTSDYGEEIAHLSEQWYCCAEPTEEQLAAF